MLILFLMITFDEAGQRIESALLRLYEPDELRSIVRELLSEATRLSRTQLLLAHKDTLLSSEAEGTLTRCLDRMREGMPLQYAVGHAPFMGREFEVSPAVLIPRPETEELVELVLSREKATVTLLHLLDVGTGSGCLAVTLARMLPVEVWAMDVSSEALAVASRNVAEGARITLVEADVLVPDARWDLLPPVDVIVSNPPYIMPSEGAAMASHVLDYEPSLALFAPEADPLLFYRAIADMAESGKLRPGGRLYVELNARLAEETCALFRARSSWHGVELHKDLSGKNRFLSAQYLTSAAI